MTIQSTDGERELEAEITAHTGGSLCWTDTFLSLASLHLQCPKLMLHRLLNILISPLPLMVLTYSLPEQGELFNLGVKDCG